MAAGNKFGVRFWGVRGSLPVPGPETAKYGGNTACVEVRCGDRIIIIDMGSGARNLGMALASQSPVQATVLISHYHWDHIMGIPFFNPLHDPRNRFQFYGEGRGGKGLKAILSGQMKYPYFPVGLEVFQADIKFNTIAPGHQVVNGGVKIQTAPLNHPQSSLAYRINYRGKSVVYCSDNEHQEETPDEMAELIKDCDLLIYDAAYTDDEYNGRTGNGSKIGWGHSTWDEAVKVARRLRVKDLYIFHHNPLRTDQVIDSLLRKHRKAHPNLHAAREGKLVTLL